MKIKIIAVMLAAIFFTGCGVGSLVALPFKVTGAVLDVFTPEVVEDTVVGAGNTLDAAIPF